MLGKNEVSIGGRPYKVLPFRTLVEVNESTLRLGEKLKVRAVFTSSLQGETFPRSYNPVAILSPSSVSPEHSEKVQPKQELMRRSGEGVYTSTFDTAGLPEGKYVLVVKYDEGAQGGEYLGIDVVEGGRLREFVVGFVKECWSDLVKVLKTEEPKKLPLGELFPKCVQDLEENAHSERGEVIVKWAGKVEGPDKLVKAEVSLEPTRGIIEAIFDFARRTVFPSGVIEIMTGVEGADRIDQIFIREILTQKEETLSNPTEDLDLLKESVPGLEYQVGTISPKEINVTFRFFLKE